MAWRNSSSPLKNPETATTPGWSPSPGWSTMGGVAVDVKLRSVIVPSTSATRTWARPSSLADERVDVAEVGLRAEELRTGTGATVEAARADRAGAVGHDGEPGVPRGPSRRQGRDRDRRVRAASAMVVGRVVDAAGSAGSPPSRASTLRVMRSTLGSPSSSTLAQSTTAALKTVPAAV